MPDNKLDIEEVQDSQKLELEPVDDKDLKKKVSSATVSSNVDYGSYAPENKSLEQVKKDLPYNILSNPAPHEPNDKPDAVKQYYSDMADYANKAQTAIQNGQPVPPKPEHKEADQMAQWIVQGQTKHLFLTQDKYQDKKERDAYYESTGFTGKEKDVLIKQGEESATKKGQYDLVRNLVAEKPTPQNLFLLAQYQSDFGDNALAQKTYQTIFNNYPKNPEAYMGFAEINVQKGNYKEANRVIQMGLEANPDSPYLLSYKAKMLYMNGNHNDALDNANKAVEGSELDPVQNIYALKTRAELRDAINNHTGANEDRAQAMALQDKLSEGAKFQPKPKEPEPDKGTISQATKQSMMRYTQLMETLQTGQPPVDQVSGFEGFVKHPISYMLGKAVDAINVAGDLSKLIGEDETIPLDKDGNPVMKPKSLADHTTDLLNGVKDLANLAMYSTPASAAIATGFGLGTESAENALKGTKGEDWLHWAMTPLSQLAKKEGWDSPLSKALTSTGDIIAQLALFKGGERLIKGTSSTSQGAVENATPSPITHEPIYDKQLIKDAATIEQLKTKKDLNEADIQKAGNIVNNVKEHLANNPEDAKKVAEELIKPPKSLPLKDIQTDEKTFQWRDKLDPNIVQDYVDKFKKGEQSEPIDVLKEGDKYTVVKGHHRFEAAQQTGIGNINANVFEGTKEQAIDYAKSFAPKVELSEEKPIELPNGLYAKEGRLYNKDNKEVTNYLQKKKYATEIEKSKPDKQKQINELALRYKNAIQDYSSLKGKKMPFEQYINDIKNKASELGINDLSKLKYKSQGSQEISNGTTLENRSPQAKELFDLIDKAGNGFNGIDIINADGTRFGGSNLDKTIKDIKSGIHTENTEAFLNNFEDAIKKDNVAFKAADGTYVNVPLESLKNALKEPINNINEEHEKLINSLTPEQIESYYRTDEEEANGPSFREEEENAVQAQTDEKIEKPDAQNLQAQNINQKLTDRTLTALKNAANSGDIYKNTFKVLADNGIISKKKAGDLLSGEELNQKGKDFVDNFFNGQIAVGGDNQLFEDVKALPKTVKDRLIQAIMPIHQLQEFSFLPELQRAIVSFDEYNKGTKELTPEQHTEQSDLNQHEKGFANILHSINTQNSPENLLNIVTDNIIHYLKSNPNFTKTDALNRYFGVDEQTPEHEIENNNLNKDLYGTEHGSITEDEKTTQGGQANPPTPPNPPVGGEGESGGQTPFKGKADDLFQQHLGVFAKMLDWFTKTDNTPYSKNTVLDVVTGNVGTKKKVTANSGHMDAFEGWTKSLTGAKSSLETSIGGLGEAIRNELPELKNQETLEKLYHFLDNKGNSNTMPDDFTEQEKTFVHITDNIRNTVGKYAQNIKEWNDKNGAFNNDQLEKIIGDRTSFMTHLNADYPGTLLQNAMKETKVRLANQPLGKWFNNWFLDNSHFILDRLGIKDPKVKDPDQMFNSRKFWRATDEQGNSKIVKLNDEGVSQFSAKDQGFTESSIAQGSRNDLIANGFEHEGKKWTLNEPATVKEIESNTNEKYIKDPYFSVMTTYTKMFQIANEIKMYESMKADPLFKDQFITLSDKKDVPTRVNGEDKMISQQDFEEQVKRGEPKTDIEYQLARIPKNAFVPESSTSIHNDGNYTKLEGLSPLWENTRWKSGTVRYMQPIISAMPKETVNFGRAIQNMVLLPALFGAGHAWNVATDFEVNMLNMKEIKDSMGGHVLLGKAYKSLQSRDDLYKVVQSLGHKFINEDNNYDKWLKSDVMPQMIMQDPQFIELHNSLGDEHHIDIKKTIPETLGSIKDGIYKVEKALAWTPQNVSNLTQLYAKMQAKGLDLDNLDYSPNTMDKISQSIAENNKRIIDYRIPTYIPNFLPGNLGFGAGRLMSSLLTNKFATMFGGYDYGRLKVLTNDIKSMYNGDASEAGEAAQRMLMRVGMLYYHNKIEAMMQQPDEDKYRGLRYTGTLKPVYETYQAVKDITEGKNIPATALEWLKNDFNLSPAIPIISNLISNQNFFGKPLYDPYGKTMGTLESIRNSFIGGDNIVKIWDGIIHGNSKELEDGVQGMVFPVNYKKDSPSEAKLAMELSSYQVTSQSIKQAHDLIFDQDDNLKVEGKELQPLMKDWYNRMYDGEGELIDMMKRSTDGLLNEIGLGGDSPLLEKHFDDQLSDYMDTHPNADLGKTYNKEIDSLPVGGIYEKDGKYFRKELNGDKPAFPSDARKKMATPYYKPNPTHDQKQEVRKWYYEDVQKQIQDRINERNKRKELGIQVGEYDFSPENQSKVDEWLKENAKAIGAGDLKNEEHKKMYDDFLNSDESDWITQLKSMGDEIIKKQ